jgi:hypothetical protein
VLASARTTGRRTSGQGLEFDGCGTDGALPLTHVAVAFPTRWWRKTDARPEFTGTSESTHTTASRSFRAGRQRLRRASARPRVATTHPARGAGSAPNRPPAGGNPPRRAGRRPANGPPYSAPGRVGAEDGVAPSSVLRVAIPARATTSVSPSTASTRTSSPSSSGSSLRAFQISPRSRTRPTGAQRTITSPRSPTSPSAPVLTG